LLSFPKKKGQFQEKKHKNIQKVKKIKNPNKKKLEKLQKNVKKHEKKKTGVKRERSGNEAGAKRQARKPWKTVKKTLKSSNPLRSRES